MHSNAVDTGLNAPAPPIYDLDSVRVFFPAENLLAKKTPERIEFIGQRLFFVPCSQRKPKGFILGKYSRKQLEKTLEDARKKTLEGPGGSTKLQSEEEEEISKMLEYQIKIENNERYLHKYLSHLEEKNVMLIQGAAGSGKTALVEEIAMLHISEGQGGDSDSKAAVGYAMSTNGCNTLTEQRLFGYTTPSGQTYKGPLARMMEDARNNSDARFVFILHEWNRVSGTVVTLPSHLLLIS